MFETSWTGFISFGVLGHYFEMNRTTYLVISSIRYILFNYIETTFFLLMWGYLIFKIKDSKYNKKFFIFTLGYGVIIILSLIYVVIFETREFLHSFENILLYTKPIIMLAILLVLHLRFNKFKFIAYILSALEFIFPTIKNIYLLTKDIIMNFSDPGRLLAYIPAFSFRILYFVLFTALFVLMAIVAIKYFIQDKKKANKEASEVANGEE